MYGHYFILIFTLLGIVSPVQAAPDATINFTGEFLAPSCTVDPETVDRTILLGTASVRDFPEVGSTRNPTAFNIRLTDCAPGTKVSMTMLGTPESVESVLKNAGTATQIGVQLLKAANQGDTTGAAIKIHSAFNLGVVPASNTMIIPLVARFYRLGTMTAGSVRTTVTVDFTYN